MQHDEITVARQFTHAPRQYVKMRVGDLTRELLARENQENKLHWTEVLPTKTPVRAYFDVDLQTESSEPVDPEPYKERALSALRARGIEQVCSICEAHGIDRMGKYKISFHIVANYSGTVATWQAVAKDCNALYPDFPKLFDTNVYHASNQKFRLVTCTKPLGGILNNDPEQRVKKLIFGEIPDTFVSYLPDSCEEYHPPADASAPMEVTPLQPTPDTLRWFEAVLGDPVFFPLWLERATNYSKWVDIGLFLAYEAQSFRRSPLPFQLFKRFSMFSRAPSPEDQLRSKFDELLQSAHTNTFSRVRRIVRDYHPAQFKQYQHIYTSVAIQSATFIQEDDELGGNASTEDAASIEVPDSLFGFVPTFSFHYRILQHMTIPAFFRFWKGQLQNTMDLKKVLSLIRYMTVEESFWWSKAYTPPDEKDKKLAKDLTIPLGKVWAKLAAMQSQYGSSELRPYNIDYRLFHMYEKNFLKAVAEAFGLPMNEGSIPDDWFTRHEDPLSIESAYIAYRKKLEEIDEASFLACTNELERHIMHPLKQYENCRPYDRFEQCIRVASEGLKWKTQIPYAPFFQKLRQTMLQELTVDGEVNEVLSRLILTYSIEQLAVEPVFGFFANAHTETAAAAIIYDLYPHWFVSVDGFLYTYDDATGQYSRDPSVIGRILNRFQNILATRKEGLTDMFFAAGGPKKKDLISKELVYLEANKPDSTRLKRSKVNTQGKMLFPNGYYDGDTDTFHPAPFICHLHRHIFIWPDLQFFGAVPDPFLTTLTTEQEQLQEELFRVLFLEMHGEEVARYRLEALAFALFRRMRKQYYVEVGPTDAGKSTEILFLTQAFGALVGTSNLNKLEFEKQNRQCASLKLDWVFHNWQRSLLLFSEGSDVTMDADILKQVVSGGIDDITCRTQHGQDVTVPVFFTMFIYLNNPMKLNKEDGASNNRRLYNIWRKRYKDLIENLETDLQKRPEVEHWPSKQIYRQMYVRLILQAYKDFVARGCVELPRPLQLIQDSPVSNEAMFNAKDIMEFLMQHYYFTGDPRASVPVNEITNRIFELTGENDKLFYKRQFASIFDSIPGKTIQQVQRKVQGRNTFMWTGIVPRESLMGNGIDKLTDFAQWKQLMIEGNGHITYETMSKLDQAVHICKITHRSLNEEELAIAQSSLVTQEHLKHLYENNPHVNS